jgi:hypothetical protein
LRNQNSKNHLMPKIPQQCQRRPSPETEIKSYFSGETASTRWAAAAGDNYHLDKCGPTGLSQTGPLEEEEGKGEERQRHWIPRRESWFPILTGDQAVPRYDPNWDPENDKDEWTHNHFIYCILEGLRRAKIKSLNYSQITAVQQGPLETPVAFLWRLKDALQKHTNIVPNF